MQVEIYFSWENYFDGFGFLCMKEAYKHGVTGKMKYGSGIGVIIQAEGEEPGCSNFIQWIENIVHGSIRIKTNSDSPFRSFKEFDIEFIPIHKTVLDVDK